MRSDTVMVVDDTTESLTLLSAVLTSEGYSVRMADSGELALASVRNKLPDLILLDVLMPGIDGFEVCRRLKADEATRGVPVIFITASMDPGESVAALNLGAVDYISKPFRREELLARVRTHLELARLRANLEQRVADRTAELSAAYRKINDIAAFQQKFMRDVLMCVTDGVLTLCQDIYDMPAPLDGHGSDRVILSSANDLSALLEKTRERATEAGIDDGRTSDLVTATNEAGMNAIVHVGAGVAEVGVDRTAGTVQVRIKDSGAGITLDRIPQATLLKGYTTAGTLGYGMKIMLTMVDHVYLLTGPAGTTVVLEQARFGATEESRLLGRRELVA